MTTTDDLCDVLGCPGKRAGWHQVRVQDTGGKLHEYSLSVCGWHQAFLIGATDIAREMEGETALDTPPIIENIEGIEDTGIT